MKLYELLKIERKDCFFLYPYKEEQERIKKLELENNGTLKNYEIAMKHETLLMGLLVQDQKEVVKSFNKLEDLLIDIGVIIFHFNSNSMILGKYYDQKDLLKYCLEMYKLFMFYKQPVCQWKKILADNPSIAVEGKKKLLYDDALLDNLNLFLEYLEQCNADIQWLQVIQRAESTINAYNAQSNLWNNSDK